MNRMIGDVKNDLDLLRLSLKHIAEAVGVDEREIPFHAFGQQSLGQTEERGWNRLAAIIINTIERAKNDGDWT